MDDLSVLVGGRAGDGINIAGMMIAWLLNASGYRPYMYYDYPSLIRGGHNFAIVRGTPGQPRAIRMAVDILLALNQDTIEKHRDRIHDGTAVLFNADRAKGPGEGVPVGDILKRHDAPVVMENSCLIGAFAKSAGMPPELVRSVFERHIPKYVEKNVEVALDGYDSVGTSHNLATSSSRPLPVVSGNEAAGLGFLCGGLDAYVAYPMTPSSSLLHFLAEYGPPAGVTVVHPENEIAVMLMAAGFAYAGRKVAVGTSGGGFCLMTEGLSLAGMAELPVVIVMSQRTGPSTGLPTYSAQSDLHFILHAGHGEFPRFICAPADATETMSWSQTALEIAWRYQVPSFLLLDKHLSEGFFSVDLERAGKVPVKGLETGMASPGRRYVDTPSGVSPFTFPPAAGYVIKANSYAHDESGVTTEDPSVVRLMTEKRLRKEASLEAEVRGLPAVVTGGDPAGTTVVFCFGSTTGVCEEAADHLRYRTVRPVVLEPFPLTAFHNALSGVERTICVEENVKGQLSLLLKQHGIMTDHDIRRSDGRPFEVENLIKRLEEVAP
jgi:2-oxoglutarate ferredoxin oxidoreductase subunit alpha